MPRTLWTPGRDVVIDGTQRDVKPIDPREMTVIRGMHAIAQKHAIVLACEHCRQPFQGLNSGHDEVETIFCGCRELKATMRGRVQLAW